MCKVANLSPESIKSFIPPSGEPAEVPVATANTTQSLDASESAEKQENWLKPVDAKRQSVVQKMHESPYDIESEIKVIKRFQPPQIKDEVSGFEAVGSTDDESNKADNKDELTQSDEATADNLLDKMTGLNASTATPSDPLGPL
nr:hypothetical protein [Tanacetum cinerariifolium]